MNYFLYNKIVPSYDNYFIVSVKVVYDNMFCIAQEVVLVRR